MNKDYRKEYKTLYDEMKKEAPIFSSKDERSMTDEEVKREYYYLLTLRIKINESMKRKTIDHDISYDSEEETFSCCESSSDED